MSTYATPAPTPRKPVPGDPDYQTPGAAPATPAVPQTANPSAAAPPAALPGPMLDGPGQAAGGRVPLGTFPDQQTQQDNQRTGYDPQAWRTLSPEQQEQYRRQGGAPSGTLPSGPYIAPGEPSTVPGFISGAEGYHGGQGLGIAPPGDPGENTVNGVTNPTAAAAPTGAGNPLKDAYLKTLLDAMGKGPPSLDDPALKAQSDAFAVGQTRAKGRAREAMAERAASMGQSSDLAGSGAFDQGLIGLEQAQGEAEAGNNASLMANEIAAQRQQLMQAAAMAGNTLSGEDSRALQERLAMLDDQFRKASMAQSGSQFDRSLSQSGSQFDRSLGQSGSQFDRSLGQSGSQFDRTFGEQGRQFDIDAELKRLGITTQGDQFSKDLELRRRGMDQTNTLGLGELDLRRQQANNQNDQFTRQLGQQSDQFKTSTGVDLAKFGADQNQKYLLELLRQLGMA